MTGTLTYAQYATSGPSNNNKLTNIIETTQKESQPSSDISDISHMSDASDSSSDIKNSKRLNRKKRQAKLKKKAKQLKRHQDLETFRDWQEQRELETKIELENNKYLYPSNDNSKQILQKISNISMRQSYQLILVIALILLVFFQGTYIIMKLGKP